MARSDGPRRSFVNGQPADLGVDLSEAFQDGDHVYARVEINPVKAAADAAAAEAEERGRKEGEAKAAREAVCSSVFRLNQHIKNDPFECLS